MESLELLPARVRIASILKKAILAGEYKSGEELSLTGIAEQLGVSRTPVFINRPMPLLRWAGPYFLISSIYLKIY